MNKLIIIGGGAAGMLAAIAASRNDAVHEIHIYEKNEKLGKKLFITGKGRCNVTNASDMEVLFNNVVTNKKFLYSAFYTFTNDDIVNLLESLGVHTKIERGNRVFPESDKSSDVIGAFSHELKRAGVNIHLNSPVLSVESTNGAVDAVILANGEKVNCDAVIICTGGVSYQTTGSTGDGMKFAKKLGHSVTDLYPGLVPIELYEEDAKSLQGLSLKNVEVTMYSGKKSIYTEFGEMLFTHYGISGPVILSGSSYVAKRLKKGEELTVRIDLKPALSKEQLDERILRDFKELLNKDFKNSLDALLPKKMIPVIIERSGISPFKKVNEITREERSNLINVLKELTFTIKGTRGFNEAIITQGGVNVKEINPGTMESKLVKNLYFAGEVMDLDAFTGGFNLQIAWSTAYLAGINVFTS